MALVLHESAEMYLKTIGILKEEKRYVHAVDIAKRMGYSKPTISEWMRKLTDDGYVTIDDNSHISLTEKGEYVASRVYDRHQLLTNFLTKIGVEPNTAETDACRIEHYISEETANAIRSHLANLA